ncbi:MAG: zinc ribbon domain-containing protein [Acidobacteria bacterium]|nr:zinc ribbon domain-containing protein [Acidobacteriota bacterium]
MPLYEYKCDACGSTFEVIQKFSDEPVAVHPQCGGPVRRLISSPALQFKGTGWYVTDYAKSGSGASSKSNGSSESKSESRSDTKSESKSESKSDSSSSSSSSSESKPAASTTSSSSDKK